MGVNSPPAKKPESNFPKSWASLRSEKDRQNIDIYQENFLENSLFFGTVGSPIDKSHYQVTPLSSLPFIE